MRLPRLRSASCRRRPNSTLRLLPAPLRQSGRLGRRTFLAFSRLRWRRRDGDAFVVGRVMGVAARRPVQPANGHCIIRRGRRAAWQRQKRVPPAGRRPRRNHRRSPPRWPSQIDVVGTAIAPSSRLSGRRAGVVGADRAGSSALARCTDARVDAGAARTVDSAARCGHHETVDWRAPAHDARALTRCRSPGVASRRATASLDTASALAVETLLVERLRAGIAIVIVTHSREQAARMGNRLLALRDSELVPA